MTLFLFWVFAILLALPLLEVMWQPARIYEFPYFMTAAFAIFILPQAVSLIRYPGAAPPEAVRKVLLVTCLCLAACLAGYRLSPNREIIRRASTGVDEGRLFHAGLAFVGCGLGFSYLLAHLNIQTSEFGGWTGQATIYGFFQQLCYPGFAICLMAAMRQPGLVTLSAMLVAAIVPVQNIIVGRREPAALFLLTIGLTLYFRRGLRPPRWAVAAALIATMLAIPATAAYRRAQIQNDWDEIRHLDLVGNFIGFLNEESVLELRNAAMLIEATSRSGDCEFGAGYWNHLIFRYVPAQIMGESFKESLMIRRSGEAREQELAGMDYANPTGSTVTAMGDSFQQFGYWGCLFFVATGVFFRSLWQAALPRQALFAQLLYMQSCTSAMRAVTHWTLDFLPGLLYNVIFLGAAMLYAASPRLGRLKGRMKNPGGRRPYESRHRF